MKKSIKYEVSSYERSFLKGFSWELISFLIVAGAIYIFYGNLKSSLILSFVLTLIKIPFYFLHERIWKKIKWGKIYTTKPILK